MYVSTYLLLFHAIFVCNSLLRPGHWSAGRPFASMHPAKGIATDLALVGKRTLQSDNAVLALRLHIHHAYLSTADQTAPHIAQLIKQYHNGFGIKKLGRKLVCTVHRPVTQLHMQSEGTRVQPAAAHLARFLLDVLEHCYMICCQIPQ